MSDIDARSEARAAKMDRVSGLVLKYFDRL